MVKRSDFRLAQETVPDPRASKIAAEADSTGAIEERSLGHMPPDWWQQISMGPGVMEIDVGAVSEQDAILIDSQGAFLDADDGEDPCAGDTGEVEQDHIGGIIAGIAIGVGPLVGVAGNAFIDGKAGRLVGISNAPGALRHASVRGPEVGDGKTIGRGGLRLKERNVTNVNPAARPRSGSLAELEGRAGPRILGRRRQADPDQRVVHDKGLPGASIPQ